MSINRVQVKDNDQNHQKARERRNKLLRSRFFTNRFAEENTSHGRIGYAGRILSASIGSRDDVNGGKSYHHVPYVPKTQTFTDFLLLFLW